MAASAPAGRVAPSTYKKATRVPSAKRPEPPRSPSAPSAAAPGCLAAPNKGRIVPVWRNRRRKPELARSAPTRVGPPGSADPAWLPPSPAHSWPVRRAAPRESPRLLRALNPRQPFAVRGDRHLADRAPAADPLQHLFDARAVRRRRGLRLRLRAESEKNAPKSRAAPASQRGTDRDSNWREKHREMLSGGDRRGRCPVGTFRIG
jgi:hypothetical protein